LNTQLSKLSNQSQKKDNDQSHNKNEENEKEEHIQKEQSLSQDYKHQMPVWKSDKPAPGQRIFEIKQQSTQPHQRHESSI